MCEEPCIKDWQRRAVVKEKYTVIFKRVGKVQERWALFHEGKGGLGPQVLAMSSAQRDEREYKRLASESQHA